MRPAEDDSSRRDTKPIKGLVTAWSTCRSEVASHLLVGHVSSGVEFSDTVEGFGRFLEANGVKHFSAREVLRPYQKQVARQLGYQWLRPAPTWYGRGLICLHLGDICRELARGPVRLRNWWRPEDYNRAVGGAHESDHLSAHAVDLDFRTTMARRRAEKKMMVFYETGLLDMSIGLGWKSLHIGCFSPAGQRIWRYERRK